MSCFWKLMSCGHGESQPICKAASGCLPLGQEAPHTKQTYPSLEATFVAKASVLSVPPQLLFLASLKETYLAATPHPILPPHCSLLSQRRWLLSCQLAVLGFPPTLSLHSCCSINFPLSPHPAARPCLQAKHSIYVCLNGCSTTPLMSTPKNPGNSQGTSSIIKSSACLWFSFP